MAFPLAFLTALVIRFAGSAPASAESPPPPLVLDYAELSRLLASPEPPLLLDVRTAEEFEAGHIPRAVLAPYDQLERDFREPDRARPIVVYCRSGRRSALARQTLLAMGYREVQDFGGVANWKGKLAMGR